MQYGFILHIINESKSIMLSGGVYRAEDILIKLVRNTAMKKENRKKSPEHGEDGIST